MSRQDDAAADFIFVAYAAKNLLGGDAMHRP
jgi:hypothetical protein